MSVTKALAKHRAPIPKGFAFNKRKSAGMPKQSCKDGKLGAPYQSPIGLRIPAWLWIAMQLD
jgi:hypothetical protein